MERKKAKVKEGEKIRRRIIKEKEQPKKKTEKIRNEYRQTNEKKLYFIQNKNARL